MTPKSRNIADFFERHRVEFEEIAPEQREEVVKRWLHTFARSVKKTTGSWVYEGFMWHGFSWEFEEAIEGQKALSKYLGQWPAPFLVFDEDQTWCYRCKSETYPDLTCLGADVYVAHHNMKWTMVFTHEQPDIGPFFREGRSKSPSL